MDSNPHSKLAGEIKLALADHRGEPAQAWDYVAKPPDPITDVRLWMQKHVPEIVVKGLL